MRALRLLKTYHRRQQAIRETMALSDEVRAIEVIGKTLDKLSAEGRERVLSYVRAYFARREAAPPLTAVSPDETIQKLDALIAQAGGGE